MISEKHNALVPAHRLGVNELLCLLLVNHPTEKPRTTQRFPLLDRVLKVLGKASSTNRVSIATFECRSSSFETNATLRGSLTQSQLLLLLLNSNSRVLRLTTRLFQPRPHFLLRLLLHMFGTIFALLFLPQRHRGNVCVLVASRLEISVSTQWSNALVSKRILSIT